MRQFVAAVGLAVIGIGTLATGRLWIGVGLLVVAVLFALAALSSRSRHRHVDVASGRTPPPRIPDTT